MFQFDEQSLTAIGAIYETASTGERWPDVLDRLSKIVGGHGAMMMVENGHPSDLQISVMSANYHASTAREYLQSVAGDEFRWIDFIEAQPARTIVKDIDVWPDREAYDGMASVSWLRSLGLYHRCVARLCMHGGWRDSVAVMYELGHGAIGAGEEARLRAFLPHLARAIEANRPFVMLERRFGAVLSMLDRLGIGVLLLRRDREIVLFNREAERILEADDGLRRGDGAKLVADDEADLANLSRVVLAAAGAAALENESEGTVLSIGRRSQGDPYALDIVPFRGDPADFLTPFMSASGLREN